MTISQPSKLFYVIDVPRITDLTADFKYNFFTPDECVNDTGGVPAEALARPADAVDASFIQWSLTRVPREVNFTFSLPRLADIGNVLSNEKQRANAHATTSARGKHLIQDNITKIIDEDFFSSDGFIAVNFHDSQIDSKIYALVSGTLALVTLEDEHNDSSTHYKSAQRLTTVLPNSIKPHFAFRALTQPASAYGAQFYPTRGGSTRAQSPSGSPKSPPPRYVNQYFDRLKGVAVNTQINSKLLKDVLDRTINDPTSTNSGDVATMHRYAASAKHAANQRFSPAVAENDYRTYVPYVDVKKQKASSHHERYTAEVVGFVIDKLEVLPDGTTNKLDPIVVESPFASMTADFRVKFHTTYCYSVRTIAQLTLPAIDDTNGDVATIKVLVSSKPSNKVYVSTTKLDAPPPPGDVDFTWDYGREKLMVSWAFPVWSQRDIKQFQVFRRASVAHPFQLQKSYNFDNSFVKFPDNEQPDPSLVEFLTSPCTYYIDDDFDFNVNITREKSFIYAVTCIDAHGLSSTYSAQYRVWFDRFKNALQVEHVSHLGAPKPYPNLYLDGDIFVNTVKVGGTGSKSLKLYFNPEYYYLFDDSNHIEPMLATKQRGGSYTLQFINLDNGKAQNVAVTIDDQTTQQGQGSPLSTSHVFLGPQRSNAVLGQ